MKTTLLLIALGLLTIPSQAQTQTPDKFYGKVVGLFPDIVHMSQSVFSTTTPTKLRFVPPIEEKATVAVGKMIDGRKPGDFEALLVELPDKLPYLAIDNNADGTITADERFTFSSAGSDRYLIVAVGLPFNRPPFTRFPVLVRYYRGLKHPKLEATDRLIDHSVISHMIGDVAINGKTVRLFYPFDPTSLNVSTTEGLFGIDLDGDNQLYQEQFSLETSQASDAEVVFRYNDLYISTESINLGTHEIVVRRRDKSEYLREELVVGREMPDFSFVDLAGKKRSLKEFRGKYLLIEWWGAWCSDCVRDMPFTVEAYDRFRSRRLEILGMNWDDKVEIAKGFADRFKVSWPNARKESITALTETTYRIQEFPSSILLGPDGKVLDLRQQELQGAALLETLDRLLPKKPN